MQDSRSAKWDCCSRVALGCLSVAMAIAPARAQEPFPGLDAYVAKAIEAWRVPGLSVAIVRNDSVVYAKGFGVLAAGTRTPVNDQTLFEIGSSSKAFTATLVAMLVSDGKMRFDDRVTTYLPTFKLYDAVANTELTIRDALTHRGGLGRGELSWLGSGFTRDEVLYRVRFLKPQSPFRSRYSYQNVMFLAAGQAAGKAGGSTWDALVKERIFTPLGMTSTVTAFDGLANRNVTAPHGLVRDSVYVKPHGNMDNIAPAGSILSSARDMAQWLRFQLNDGMVSGKRLVSSSALRETHTPQILMGAGAAGPPDSAGVTLFSTYGMGWMVQDYRHQLMWQHGGNTDGMTAAVGMLPEHRFGVVVLSNMASAQLPNLLMRYMFDRQLGAAMRDWSGESYTRMLAQRRRADSTEAAQTAQRTPGAKPPLPLAAYTGTYTDSLYGDATVSIVGEQLELRRGEWRGPLEFWNASNFRWTILPSSPTGPLFIKFDVGPDDKVNGMYFGLGADTNLMGRKAVARRGGRGGRGGPGGTSR
jgi:CubicO group peptidase (beta-lactamase class C family)